MKGSRIPKGWEEIRPGAIIRMDFKVFAHGHGPWTLCTPPMYSLGSKYSKRANWTIIKKSREADNDR